MKYKNIVLTGIVIVEEWLNDYNRPLAKVILTDIQRG